MSWLYAIPMLGIIALTFLNPAAGGTAMLVVLGIFAFWLALHSLGVLMRWLTSRRRPGPATPAPPP